jgi:hypothetical protein
MKSAEQRDNDNRGDAPATEEVPAAGDSSTVVGGGSEGYGPGGDAEGYGSGGGPGGYGSSDGHGRNDGRPRSDPILTKRFQALDVALHGAVSVTRRQALNWSGVNDTTVAFASIEDALGASVPVDRPTSDLPQKSGNQRAGD